MRVRTLLVGVFVALAVSTAWAGQIDVRAIDIKGLNLGDASQGRVDVPMVITSADELYNAIDDELAASEINGQVDFTKEYLLLFKWEGSGRDRLGAAVVTTSAGEEVKFTLRPGMTLDLRPHYHAFALPNEATWAVDIAMPATDD